MSFPWHDSLQAGDSGDHQDAEVKPQFWLGCWHVVFRTLWSLVCEVPYSHVNPQGSCMTRMANVEGPFWGAGSGPRVML